MSKKSGYPTAGLIVLVIILILMYTHAMTIDKQNCSILKNSNYVKEPDQLISSMERCKVEQIIREYKTRKSMNKSQSNRILKDTALGAIRGALGGAILGGDAGIVPGMIAFGALNGILSWTGAHIEKTRIASPIDSTFS